MCKCRDLAVRSLTQPEPGFIILLESLHMITQHCHEDHNFNLPAYLSSFIIPDPKHPKRQLSLVGVYHTDILSPTSSANYAPSPLAQMSYLATSIMTLHSVAHLAAQKAARDRSLAAPVFGLDEEADGIVIGSNPLAKSLKPQERGLVIELEHRRKSGRGVLEWFFLPSKTPQLSSVKDRFREYVTLLNDHPLFRESIDTTQHSEEELSKLSFDLSLTERQRLERQGVVLPYFDAQKGDGAGEGGRILYEMGAEDDFDDEEDED